MNTTLFSPFDVTKQPMFAALTAITEVYSTAFRHSLTENHIFATRIAKMTPSADLAKTLDTDITLLQTGMAKRMIDVHAKVNAILSEQGEILKKQMTELKSAG
ncbi:MAG: hypothetical protein Q7S87_10390 [Agitococcus sp.]|nr:hypothetical protein [Agitococcus sp.]MDO9179463.1 hypothetical protein [Agitococcus sp.]